MAILNLIFTSMLTRLNNFRFFTIKQNCFSSIVSFLVFIADFLLNYGQIIREKIPLGFLVDPENDPHIKENWFDNPTPSIYTIIWRITVNIFNSSIALYAILNHFKVPENRHYLFWNKREVILARIFTLI
jgi:hypothetical protein